MFDNNKKTHFWENSNYLPYSTILSNQSKCDQPKTDKILHSDEINSQQSNLTNINQLPSALKTESRNNSTQSDNVLIENKMNKTTNCFSFISQRLSDNRSYSYGNISKRICEPDPKKYSYKRRKSLALIHGFGFRGRKIQNSNSSKLNQQPSYTGTTVPQGPTMSDRSVEERTQDHCIHNQPPSSLPIIPPTSNFTPELPLSGSPSSVTIANDSSAQNTVPGLLKPRFKLHIGAFNLRTLCQIGQQASLAKTLESLTIDVCCVYETRIQDPSVVIHLTSPRQNGEPTRYTLRVSGDSTASSRGLAGLGIALSRKAEQPKLEWIPV
ncbi:unnamed protein product, partial [Schistosoma curassoni]|uniref:Velvet domain-containing protein n=1 Tax=Schistosoma curassoni TaxID=6186 RepID=A0A183L2P1_9TREM